MSISSAYRRRSIDHILLHKVDRLSANETTTRFSSQIDPRLRVTNVVEKIAISFLGSIGTQTNPSVQQSKKSDMLNIRSDKDPNIEEAFEAEEEIQEHTGSLKGLLNGLLR